MKPIVDWRELRILILDGDVERARETREILRDYGIPSVFRAETAEDALGTLRASKFSAVVLDMPLSDEEAAGFMKGLRNPRRSPSIGLPVVLITSSPTAEDLQLAIKMGIDHFVGRPYPAKRLVDTVESVVGQPVAQEKTQDYVGPNRRRLPFRDYSGPERRG